MNFFQLIFKQMRQRSLSTWLTILSVLLGVGLAVAVMILRRESSTLLGQSDFGYEMIVGPAAGSPLQLTLNTVYHMDKSPGNIPYSLYEEMAHKPHTGPMTQEETARRATFARLVHLAIPFMVGDSFKGHRIVGTSPQMFGFDDEGKPVQGTPFEYKKDKSYQLAQGHVFAPRKFEAVLGSDVAAQYHMTLYDPKLSEPENAKHGAVFQATHGLPGPNEIPDIHKPKWHVVGILQPTHTANDRVLFIPVISLYAIEEHDVGLFLQAMARQNFNPRTATPQEVEDFLKRNGFDPANISDSLRKKVGLPPLPPPTAAEAAAAATQPAEEDPDAYHLDANGDIVPDLPRSAWEISAILVKTRSTFAAEQLQFYIQTAVPEASAIYPAVVMREFFDTFFGSVTTILLVISLLVTVVAAVGILVSIYNSVSARMREIAILRALGATRGKILSLICVEAMLIGFIGSVLGIIAGHAVGGVESYFFNERFGQSINWLHIGWRDPWYANELNYLVLVVVIALLAGLVPAFKAYRSPVATNLTAS